MTAPRFLILADGDFGPMTSKTANSVIRYLPERTVGVLDRQQAGKTAQDVLGFGGDIPVVGSMRAGLALKPTAVLVGHRSSGWAAAGGVARLAGRGARRRLRPLERAAHLPGRRSDPGRQGKGQRPEDLRHSKAAGRPSDCLRRAKSVEPYVVLTVGHRLQRRQDDGPAAARPEAQCRGLRTRFVATGQTGIMIEGWGIAVDAVVADFVAGAAERLVLQGSRDADIVLVEGQGSINHPGYSAVTLGLMHGSCPDAMILCHQSTREYIGDYRPAAWLRIPPLSEYIRLYETIGSAVHPTKVIGISLNTYDMTDEAARRACEAATRETGLPATDPVRFDPAPLLDAVRRGRQEYLASRRDLVTA